MITWTCTTCHQPIPDHDGYLIVDELKADLGEFQLWLPLHTDCIPDPEVGYGIDVHRLRTAEDFDWWDAHLAGKSWISNTDWTDIYATGGPLTDYTDALQDAPARLDEAEADRDRARSIAVALEQENAALEGEVEGRDGLINYYADLAHERDLLLGVARDTLARFRAEAEAAHGVIEQAGLLQEHMATLGLTGAEALRQVLNGGTFEEVRRG